MLADRHQLDVRIAHLQAVGDKLVGQIAIVQPAVMAAGTSLPASQVYLVDADGFIELIRISPPIQPFLILPLEPREVGDNRRRAGRQLGRKTVRIALIDYFAVRLSYTEF